MGERPCRPSLLDEEDDEEGELNICLPDSEDPGDLLSPCWLLWILPCLLGDIRSPLARIDSVDEFNARADDDTKLRFKDELGLSSSSPSSYPSTEESVFSAKLGITGFVTQLSRLLKPIDDDDELDDSIYLCANCDLLEDD